MGLIDILTHYDTKKKAAHAMKTAKHGVICNIKLYTSCLIYGIKLFKKKMTLKLVVDKTVMNKIFYDN